MKKPANLIPLEHVTTIVPDEKRVYSEGNRTIMLENKES
jgi:hypothetical protein